VDLRVGRKDRYLIQGPIPVDVEMKEHLREFFVKAYTNYLSIAEEEGYNRSFLDDEGYLVCDQVYASKNEKVELFDVLYYGDQNDIFLYHIKEGFGQKTRDACSQIRNAAIMLRTAIDQGSYEILKNLYKNATTSESATPFRKKLKKSLEVLTEESFIDLFKNKVREQIVFVYAFLDDAATERLLENENDPGHTFTKNDFRDLGIPIDNILSLLQDKNLLDEKHQLSDTFLRLTEDSFKSALKSTSICQRDLKKIYEILCKHLSQYDSAIAKIELLHIKREIVEELGFGFKICQIRRTPNLFTQTEVLCQDLDQSEMQLDVSSISSFSYQGIKNGGNDCFLNSAFQLMIRSSLWSFFLDGNNLQNLEIEKELFDTLTEFNEQYFSKETIPTTNQFRSILKFHKSDQGDAAEVIDKIASKYKLKPIASTFNRVRKVDPKKKTLLKDQNIDQLTQINQDCTLQIEESHFLLKLDLITPADSSNNVSFQELLDNFLNPPTQDDLQKYSEEIKFVEDGKAYQVPVEFESLEPKKLSDELFLQIKRFNQDNVKLNTNLTMETGSFTFCGHHYELTGFIIHVGETTKGGHYMCFNKIETEWICFDTNIKKLEQEQLEKEFSRAYIIRLHVKK